VTAAAAFAGEWTLHLIHFTAQGSIAAVLLLAVSAAIPRSSPAFRSALLGVALLKFVVPPMLPFPTGFFSRFGAVPAGFFGAPRSAAFGAIAAFHVAGAAASFLRLARERRRMRRIRRAATAVDAPGLAELARRAGLSRPPELRVSREVPVPCALGGRRPAILLPERVLECVPEPERELILAHELAHLRRRDPFVEAAESLVASLWWFNPLLRLLVERRRELREERCDAEVLRSAAGRGRQYSLALLSVASLAVGARRSGTVAATGSRSHLERRLRRIAEGPGGKGGRVAGAFAIAAAAVLVLPGVHPGAPPPARPAAPVSSRR